MRRIYLTKYFRHQDTKFNYNKHLLFVSLCLCGYSFRFIRVGAYTNPHNLCYALHTLP
jgi:hypothetical protein